MGVNLAFPAVPAFLAISGFCILGSYERSSGWPEFIWKRICRVYPAFFAMLLIVLVFGGFKNCWGVFVAYLTLGIHGNPWNNVVWSLGWEELFYGLLAVMFTMGAYKRRWPIWVWLGVAMCWGALLPHFFPRMSPFLQVAMPLGTAFFIGNLAYIYREHLTRFLWAGPVLFFAGAYLLALNWVIPAAAACSLGVILTGMIPIKLPKFPDLSYGFYLYHIPVAGVVFYRYHQSYAWCFVATAVVCIVSWHLVEKPGLKLKERPPRFRREAKPVLEPETAVA